MRITSRLIIFTIALCVFFLYSLLFDAPQNFISGTKIEVEEGSSLRSISKLLSEKNVIRSRTIFETLITIKNGEKSIRSNIYTFNRNFSVFDVVNQMSEIKNNLGPIRVTIPEGYTSLEIAEVFADHLVNFDKDDFLQKTSKDEGYLFPDTYFFSTDDNADEVIKLMTENFSKKTSNLIQEIENQNRELRDIIIMASIIEKEANGDDDRDIIAGILWKRIEINMPLQVDAWPETYKSTGLPKDPICNPGLKAIIAATRPTKSSYLYYLHDRDGETYYASDFDGHKANKAKYLKK